VIPLKETSAVPGVAAGRRAVFSTAAPQLPGNKVIIEIASSAAWGDNCDG